MTQLTNKDIDNLMEALDAWEAKDNFGGLMEIIFDSITENMLDEESKAERKERNRIHNLEVEREKIERKEKSVLLKAKLITIKQDNLVNDTNNILGRSQNG